MAEQPKATGGQPFRLLEFQMPSGSSTKHRRPRRHRKEPGFQFHGGPEPLGRSEALRYLVEVGIKSYKPHKGRKASQTSRLPLLYVAGRVGGSAGGLCDGRVE
jgi:hypothetical protein